jgi:hypothetical protein
LTWERSEFSDPMGCNEFSLVLVCAIGARVRQPDCPHSAYFAYNMIWYRQYTPLAQVLKIFKVNY